MNTLMIIVGILAAAVVRVILGMTWFSKSLFGTRWMQLAGVRFDKNDPALQKKMMCAMVGGILSALLIAAVMACFMYRMQITTISSGIMFGLTAWLGFVATSTLKGVLYEQRPFQWFVLVSAFDAVAMSCMGAVLAWFLA